MNPNKVLFISSKMDKIQSNNAIIKLLSKISFFGQQLIVSSCINMVTYSFLPDCNKIEGSSTGFYDKCTFFYHHFLVIWWLNFIMCSLSLTLSFDHRHSVIRSLVVFILTIWEFTFLNSPGSSDSLMPLFVIFFRSIVFGLLIWDIIIDVDFRNCIVLVYDHVLYEIVYPFFDFLEDYIDAFDELPWIWNVIDGLDDISKFALCTNV